jgi:hypothetical protein
LCTASGYLVSYVPTTRNLLTPICTAQGELTRIKDKISVLLKRKDAARSELSETLYELQQRSATLQETLEDLRATALAN